MRISDWSSDVCSSDLFAPLPCCALALAGLRRIGCRAVAQTGVAANPIVRTLPDGRQVLFGLTRGDFTTRTATAPKDGKSRSEEHTSELQSLMRISYAVFCLKKKNHT